MPSLVLDEWTNELTNHLANDADVFDGTNKDAVLKEIRSLQSQHEKRLQDLLSRQEDRIVSLLSETMGRPCSPMKFPMDSNDAQSGQWEKLSEGQAAELVRDASDDGSRGEVETRLPGQMETDLDTDVADTANTESRPCSRSEGKNHARTGAYNVDVARAQTGGRITMQLESIQSFSKPVAGEEDSDAKRGMIAFRYASKIVNHKFFEIISCFAIFADSLLIGIEADQKMSKPLADTPPVLLVFNWMLIIGFTVELLLRMANEGKAYYSCNKPNIAWNLFDTILVVSSWIEPLMQLAGAGDTGIDISAMRMFRIMRMIRGLRLIRVFRFFKDLRVMLQGIFRSMQSLIWALVLLISLMYMFAVCVLQFAVEEVAARESDERSSTLSDSDYASLMTHFPSIMGTIYTLFQAISGGVDWGQVAQPLLELGTLLGILFIFYVAFATLCVLNIITGVFVDNANKIATKDDDMIMMEQLEMRAAWFDEVKELFKEADVDNSGTVTEHEFAEKMQDLRVQAWLRKIGVQVESYSAEGLFKLLDFDGDGSLELEEFALALQSVHGTARSIDLQRVAREAKLLREDMVQLCDLCNTAFERLMPGISKVKVHRTSQVKKEDTVFYDMERRGILSRESHVSQ